MQKAWIMFCKGVASFSTTWRPGWRSFPRILKIARMTSTHWPHQHFELLSFISHPNNDQWSSQKLVGPGLQVYGLATPLFWIKLLTWQNEKGSQHSLSKLCLLQQYKWNKIRIRLPRLTINAPYGSNFITILEFFISRRKKKTGRCREVTFAVGDTF